jgi:GDP-4-dehydro-6-deoxy-D-mannose reductase
LNRVWVTGSHGFVGPWLIRVLLDRGVEVLGIDRPGRASATKIEHTELQLDLLDAEAVRRKIRETRPDAVFHLAAQSSAAKSFTAPGETLHVNLQTTVSLLEGIRQAPDLPTVMLSVGSCEEYGPIHDPLEIPVGEDHALRPASPYAVSKTAQTLLCLQYHEAYDMPIVCTRSFTHTGPGQSDRFVFSSFARQIAEQELRPAQEEGKLRVGNLAAVRDLSDVRDVARCYVELTEKGQPGEVYNVCSGHGLSIEEGLRMLRSLSAREVDVEVDPQRLRPLDVPVLIGNADKLRATLGWTPSTPPEKTLEDLLQDWRDRLSRGDSGG